MRGDEGSRDGTGGEQTKRSGIEPGALLSDMGSWLVKMLELGRLAGAARQSRVVVVSRRADREQAVGWRCRVICSRRNCDVPDDVRLALHDPVQPNPIQSLSIPPSNP